MRRSFGTFTLACLAGAGLLAGAPPAVAQPISRDDLPPSLRAWVPWVLDQAPTLGCATVQGEAVCAWPGRLRLELGASGGTFELELVADRAGDVRLPGSAERWPQDVRLDGAPAPVVPADDAPRLRVPAGRHRVAGRFAWSRAPESLLVPAEIGLVDLRLDGRPVARPRRDAAGLLWLRAADQGSGEGESLRLQVFRQVKDGIPVFVVTRLELEVAGRARELTLPHALLPGTVATAVTGDLPARVEDHAVRIQVRGGRYSVQLEARADGRLEAVSRAAGGPKPPWPEREVWVFAADESKRQVELSGPAPIDPSRTELPAEWAALPAFLVEPGASLTLKELRRGEASPPPDALTLTRELWLDQDGGQAIVRDQLAGQLRATTRLDLLPPGTLGRVAVSGQDQLVTANPETKARGVELRGSTLQLEADSRLEALGPLPAVGWTADVESLQATLHLPPGWTLLAATGVDRVPGTWTSRWTLLGFFFVLIVTLAVDRLFGRAAAALALATLVLLYGESDAPSGVFVSLVAAIALLRVAPRGVLARLARAWFWASAAVLVVASVPFARDQVKEALFPQVADGAAPVAAPDAAAGGAARDQLRQLGYVADAPAAQAPASPESAEAVRSVEEKAQQEAEPGAAPARKAAGRLTASQNVAPRGDYAYNVALEQDPKAVLQTGPGVPAWRWRSYSLGWSGPVDRDHRMRLWLASPALNRALTLLRLGLLALLGFLLVAGRWPSRSRPSQQASPGPDPTAAPAAPLALVLLFALGALPRAASAQDDPSPERLEELKRRLTRPAVCEPRCVTTPSVLLRLGDSRLQLAAEVHAGADGAWAVPGPVGSWVPSDVRVNGAAAAALARRANGFLYLRLPRGVHRVEAEGPVPPGDSFTLQFADPPRRARAEAPGWEVSGLRADGPAETSVLLTRRLVQKGEGAAEGRYAPWLEVTRTLRFGVSWTVTTEVRRVTPLGAPIALRVPLLAGEAPTTASLVVEKGEAAVSLGGDEEERSWTSTLEPSGSLELRAPEGRPWSEVWRLQCSPVWSCASDGIPPVSRFTPDGYAPEFRPWPGESLKVALAHPQGVEGQTLTIDALLLEATPGQRLDRVRLVASARSSREQPLVLKIPKDAEVQQVTIDGQERVARPEQGELRVTVPAGSHALELRFQQARGMGVAYALPRVTLSTPAVNVTQRLALPPDRWLVAARGPAWGPAVLFWPYLFFLVALAAALGRLPASPLTTTQWILLGLGLSVLPATGALVVALFVFALAQRGRRQPASAPAFDLVQLGLLAWALVTLGLLYTAIEQGLLFRPNMQVAGNGSSDTLLAWYTDRVGSELPAAGVLSLPLWVYRVAMLLWALWLAASLVRGFGPAWRAFSEGGLWRPLVLRRPSSAPDAGQEP